MLQLPSLVSPIPKRKGPPNLAQRVGLRESACRYLDRDGLKDLTSSSLNIKGSKAADQRDYLDMRTFRWQVKQFPEAQSEQYRVDMNLEEDKKQRDLQDFQFIMILKLQKMLTEQMVMRGEDPMKFHIGGHDRALYERFFKTEPMQYMSEPQFVSAMKKVFGDEVIKKKEREMRDLYESFDARRLGKMVWRSFMCLIVIVMLPGQPFSKYVEYSFVLYASSGSFDLDCRDKVPLSAIKEIFCIPVKLVYRNEVQAIVAHAWAQFSVEDFDAARAVQNYQGTDPEGVKISLPLLRRMMAKTILADYVRMGTPFGKRDLRPWTYRFEDLYYHEVIPPLLKKVRREFRNEAECIKFIAMAAKRALRSPFHTWRKMVTVRARTRILFIDCSIRWKNIQCADFFDKWRKNTMEEMASVHMERICRGFIARKRKVFIRQLNRRVVRLQAQVRQVSKRVIFRGIFMRKQWAAVHIQRMARGHQARRRVMGILEAKVDTELRIIKKKRAQFQKERTDRSVLIIQRNWKTFVRSRIALAKVEKAFEAQKVGKVMEKVLNEGIVQRDLFKEQLKQWYDKRREEYFKFRLDNNSTNEAKRRIVAHRNHKKNVLKAEQQKQRDLMRKKMEENKVEVFVRKWEIIMRERMAERKRMCHQALLIPETPEEEALKKDLVLRIKKHTPVVLHRADKQKIPMEIPEAREIAQIEVIEHEIKEEKKRIKIDMRAAADEVERQEEIANKNEKAREEKIKWKKRGWGSLVIQKSFRGYLGRIQGRELCFKRYKKFYDVPSGQYFYMDFKTKRTTWVKPVMFGSYDVDADEGWLLLRDTQDEPYYYNPRRLTMQWSVPFDTVMCEVCKRDFAVGRLNRTAIIYCDACMCVKVADLLHKLPPGRIFFKRIDGNIEGSALKDVEMLDDTSWQDHLDSLDPEHGKKGDNDSDDGKEVFCGTCEDNEANTRCEMCMAYFCFKCYDLKHRKEPWCNHVKKDMETKEDRYKRKEAEKKEEREAKAKAAEKKRIKKEADRAAAKAARNSVVEPSKTDDGGGGSKDKDKAEKKAEKKAKREGETEEEKRARKAAKAAKKEKESKEGKKDKKDNKDKKDKK
jgi:hypothetical protein